MRPSDFKRWRKALGLSQKAAAEALGLKRRVLQYYEKGERNGEKVAVPKTVRLACYALLSGIADYHGPEDKPPAGDAGGGDSGRQAGGETEGETGGETGRTGSSKGIENVRMSSD